MSNSSTVLVHCWVHLPLPTGKPVATTKLYWGYVIQTHLRAIEPGTWMGDLDIGETFLNFPLHHASLQKVCGVDMSSYGLLAGAEKGCGGSGCALAPASFDLDSNPNGTYLIAL
jgi:hypothetical protein